MTRTHQEIPLKLAVIVTNPSIRMLSLLFLP